MQIHFRNYPSSTLLAWHGSQSLLQAFLNSLKEAAVICAGNAAPVLQMSQQAQQDLWKSVESSDLASYQRIAQSLAVTPKARGDKPPGIPVRLYVQHNSGGESQTYCVQLCVAFVSVSVHLNVIWLVSHLADTMTALHMCMSIFVLHCFTDSVRIVHFRLHLTHILLTIQTTCQAMEALTTHRGHHQLSVAVEPVLHWVKRCSN